MKKWKKYTNLLLALVMCLSLTACGDTPEETIGDTDMDIEEESNPVSDISGFTGCWKMENAPFYFVINDSYEWTAVNLYNEQIGPGYFTAEEDTITLCMADKSGGTVYMSFLRNGKMHVAVKTERDFFELGKGNADVGELRQKFSEELRWFTDMIDTLRVEDTLYKKEENI